MLADRPPIERRFVLDELVGRGAFGEVYRGRERVTGARVAIKRLLGNLADPAAAERFDREARLVAQVSSPFVVRYVDHGPDEGGQPCLVLEWLEGEDLKRRQQWRPLTVAQAVDVARQGALGLDALHRAGIVHRDVKPSNFFITGASGDDLHVKLIDLGTARGGGETPLTVEGWAIGTPAYMSPEQARGDPTLAPPSDLFSLGVVLFELLSGRRPFRGPDNYAVLAKIVLEDAPRLLGAVVGVSPELDELVARALAKRPELRFSSAGDMAEALAAVRLAPSGSPPEELPTAEMRTPLASASGGMLSIPRVSTLAEQRVVTTVFASFAALPPDRQASALTAFSSIVSERGGAPHAMLGSRAIGVFGSARSAGDEVVRGAQAALLAAHALPSVALAIATGRVQADSEGVSGEAIERGGRLIERFDGSPCIDGVTARLLGARFAIDGEGEEGQVLVGEREIDVLPPLLLGRATTCVGRDRELAVLDGIWTECVAERVARVALVTAPAGVGKTRLMHELVRRIATAGAASPSPAAPPSPTSLRGGAVASSQGVGVIYGRGESLGAGSPFGLIGPAIRRTARIHGAEPIEARRKKLLVRIGRHMAPAEAQRVAPFLGELAAVPFADDADPTLRAARADPLLMGDAMRVAFCDWLAAETAARPLLFLVDDLHWGDLPSVRLIDAALRQLTDQPLLVVALARPEVHGHFPGLWAERAVHEIRLGPLTKKAAERLVREVLGASVSDATVQRIVSRAEGNAFFLEELIRGVAEGQGDRLPDTILGMVQSRLDALGTDAKRVLRAASVFGGTFWLGGVVALIGGETRAALAARAVDDLVAREVVVDHKTSRFAGEREVAFRHAIVREAAYAILTDADRALAHRLAGDWLEGQGESDAMLLAHHMDQGGQALRAAAFYRRAAEQALEGNDLAAAISRAEQGVRCGAAHEILGALRLVQAEAHAWRGAPAAAEQAALAAVAELREGSASWFRAAAQIVWGAARVGGFDRVAAWTGRVGQVVATDGLAAQIACLGRGAVHLYEAGRLEEAAWAVACIDALASDPASLPRSALAAAHLARARRALAVGDPVAAAELAQAAVASFEEARDGRQATATRIELGHALVRCGAFSAAEAALRSAMATAEALGLAELAALAAAELSPAVLSRGDVALARDLAERSAASARSSGSRRLEGAARLELARASLAANDPARAETEARAAAVLLETSGPARAEALALVARAQLTVGRVAEALLGATEAVRIAEILPDAHAGEILVRLTLVDALVASRDHDRARATLVAACDRLAVRAARFRDAGRRAAFLTLVPEHARALAIATAWGCEPAFD